MRVGYDVTPLCTPLTGVGVYTAQLLRHLRPLLGADLMTLAHRSRVWTNGHVAATRVDLVSPWQVNKTLWMQAVLPHQIRKAGLDVCHFTNSVAPLWCPCPVVVTVHDASLWLYPEYHYPRRLLAMRPLVPLVARRAAAVITVSHSARQDLVRVLRLPPEKVHVIYEAPSPAFRPLSHGPWVEEVRRRYHLPDRFLLYVGTLEPRKNLVRLIRAFARLKRGQGIPHALLLVGRRGWKDRRIFAAVEAEGVQHVVRFLGYVPEADLVALYNLADAFVFPSLYEGFGLPVVEAMACGTPVITSGRGALAEITADAAEWVDPLDETSIAEGIARVLTDPARAAVLSEAGRQRVRAFRWERTAHRTLAVYRQVAAGAPRA